MALNHVFFLTGMDLVSSLIVSQFERSCPPLEVRPPDWDLSLVLRCLSRAPFELLKLASEKHLTWKTSFLLTLASAKGLVSCMVFPFVFINCVVGNPAPSLFFLTLWTRPRILLFLILGLMSPRSRLWTILSTVTGMNSCSVPSELFLSTFPGRSGIVLRLRVYSFPLVCERNRCLVTPFLSGCGQSSLLLICLLRRRIVVLFGSGLTKSGRLRRFYCLRGIAWSIRY